LVLTFIKKKSILITDTQRGCTASLCFCKDSRHGFLSSNLRLERKISNQFDQAALLGISVALGVGLLIGAEREQRKHTGPNRDAAGIRTFCVAALLGAVSAMFGGTLVMAIAALFVSAGALLAYQKTRQQDPGMTTEFALLLTCLLGGLAIRDPLVAAGLGVVLASLLAARNRLHHFVRTVLTERELHDIILFFAAALIVLPLTPDRFMGPFDAINPHSIARLIVMVMAISAFGYVALRTLGPRFGLPLAGFAAGFVSSTATVHSMGARARQHPMAVGSAAAGAALSSVATTIQMAFVVALIQPNLLKSLWLPLGFGGVTAGLYAVALLIRSSQSVPPEPETGRAFDLKMAAGFAALISALVVMSAALNAWMGSRGLLVGAALAGLVDAHATAASAASLMAAQKITSTQAVGPILVALSANTLMKAAVAFNAGGVDYAKRVMPGLALMIAAVWLGAWMV
jgi:uncharacterized membrane protein (DUF4010 family)